MTCCLLSCIRGALSFCCSRRLHPYCRVTALCQVVHSAPGPFAVELQKRFTLEKTERIQFSRTEVNIVLIRGDRARVRLL